MLTFWEFRLCSLSDRSSDVAKCDQTITFKFKIDSLLPKTESGYLQRKWVFATKHVFANKWKKVKQIEWIENGGNSSYKAQSLSAKITL